MPFELLQYVSNHLSSILTGLTMAVIGIAVYEARDGFFLFRGKFRGKIGALIVFITTLFVASLTTPLIDEFWMQNVPYLPSGQILGLILILGMLGVNKTAEWNYFDTKSVVVYGTGILLLFEPNLLNMA